MSTELQQELRRFAETTTIKGVGRTVRADRRIVRVFWILALLSCLGVLLYQISTVLTNYLKYNVIRNAGVEFRDPMFPDITVCNLFSLSDLNKLENYPDYARDIETMKSHATDGYRSIGLVRLWKFLKSIASYNIYSTASLESPPNSTQDDLLFECFWYGWDRYAPRNCSTHFQLVAPLKWCQTVRTGAGPPSAAALSLLLFSNARSANIHDSIFDSWIRFSRTSGVRVIVHRSGTIPNPVTSIDIAPGTETTISLKQTNTDHLPYPYGNCTEQKTFDPTRLGSPVYNAELCISLCRQRQLIEACHCIDPYMMFTEAELLQMNHTFCNNVTDSVILDAQGRVDPAAVNDSLNQVMCMWNFVVDSDRCDCRPLCSDTEYETTVTTVSKWPKLTQQLSFYDQYLRNHSGFEVYKEIAQAQASGNLSSEKTLERLRELTLIEENFLQIFVKFDQKSVQLVTEVPAITWDTLASNFGGSFNLWLGISVPTAAELIELVYSMAMIWWQRRKPKTKPIGLGITKETKKTDWEKWDTNFPQVVVSLE